MLIINPKPDWTERRLARDYRGFCPLRTIDPPDYAWELIHELYDEVGRGADLRVRIGPSTEKRMGRLIRSESSWGATWITYGVIGIRIGYDEKDVRETIIHEFTHWAVQDEWHGGHHAAFYRKLFELTEKYGDLAYCIDREIAYKPRVAVPAVAEYMAKRGY